MPGILGTLTVARSKSFFQFTNLMAYRIFENFAGIAETGFSEFNRNDSLLPFIMQLIGV